MEENNENNTNIPEEVKTQNAEEVKEQTDDKVEHVKSANFKREANEAKNFFVNFFKSPLSEIKKVVSTPKSFWKIIVILLVAWVIFECIGGIIEIVRYYSYSSLYLLSTLVRNSFSVFFDMVLTILVPVAFVAVLSFIIYLLMKEKKKNYLTIVATIIIAKIPVIIASLISLLGYVNDQVSIITSTFSDFAHVISTALIYFAVKALYSEDDDNEASRTFLKVMAIYFVVILILRFFGIDIYC